MKTSIKRLRTCNYSTAVAPEGFLRQKAQQTNKLICDHPEMKIDWTLDACETCKVYVNRNQPAAPEPITPQASLPKPVAIKPTTPKAIAPEPVTPKPTTTATAEPEPAEPKKTRGRKPKATKE
jgi:hypothetical protein